MNNKFKTAFCLVIAHCAAATANFIFLLGTGEDSPLKWVFLAVTLLYLGAWAWFTARRDDSVQCGENEEAERRQ